MSDITLNAPKLFDLSGQVAIVTGAGSGIGQRIAIGLAQCGADVALLDRRTDDGLAKTAEHIRAAGRRSIQIAADVTSKSSLGEGMARTEADLGALTLAVNAAGIANANAVEEMEEDQYQTLMDINLKGVFLSCQAEARAMDLGCDRKRDRPRQRPALRRVRQQRWFRLYLIEIFDDRQRLGEENAAIRQQGRYKPLRIDAAISGLPALGIFAEDGHRQRFGRQSFQGECDADSRCRRGNFVLIEFHCLSPW